MHSLPAGHSPVCLQQAVRPVSHSATETFPVCMPAQFLEMCLLHDPRGLWLTVQGP